MDRIVLLLWVLACASVVALAQDQCSDQIPGGIIPGGPPKDGIPPIDHPKFNAADVAPPRDTDMILGVEYDGVAKAYPILILNWHEVVNDVFGDKHLAVTYCPLVATGILLDSTAVDTLGTSGYLYQNNLIFY
eukprot:GFYU01019384.1.p1 GENE.GFYU01019384.1~~GFYU01019384.1.p1  ORF type:complete len:133 (+),score=21.04 GFYU01019384.1:92-490(+)